MCSSDLAAAELRVPIVQHEASPSALFAQHQQQVAGLLGDPLAVGVGGDAGQVNPAGVQFDEEQHVQPLESDGVDGEEVARDDSGGLLAQECPPGGGRPPWRGVQPVAAQRGADHRRREAHAKAEQLAWMRW